MGSYSAEMPNQVFPRFWNIQSKYMHGYVWEAPSTYLWCIWPTGCQSQILRPINWRQRTHTVSLAAQQEHAIRQSGWNPRRFM